MYIIKNKTPEERMEEKRSAMILEKVIDDSGYFGSARRSAQCGVHLQSCSSGTAQKTKILPKKIQFSNR